MKPSWRNEARDAEVSGKTQFEGRTAEEAVARARKALGDTDALRCWKTRKGGVGGFFAREVFVASLTPPPGSESPSGKGVRPPSGKTNGRRRTVSDGSALSTDAISTPDPPPPGGRGGPEDHLAGLVEATNDQLSLQSLAIPAGAFDQVLAEAQAALARLPEIGDTEGHDREAVSPPDELAGGEATGSSANVPEEPGSAEAEGSALERTADGLAPATTHGVGAPKSKPKAKARPKRPAVPSVARIESPQRGRVPRLPDLKPGLRGLGVPNAYLPPGRRASLDLLADAMATLPVPGPLPTTKDAVVAVVGADDTLARTVDLVMTELSLARGDVLMPLSQGTAAARAENGSLCESGSPRLDRQIARRRAKGRRSVLAVSAAPGRPLTSATRGCLEQAAPDYVLAAVGAGCKRADVEHGIGELPRVDSLALWDLAGTRTPAEMLGVLPVAFVDGDVGSPLGWTLLLAGRAVGWRQ
jgi:hypothetical protein